jgi:mannose/fructose/N-acetylgalactosamine-specific phosphotransferase system component IIC
MSKINKFLCKYYGTDDNGDVTLGRFAAITIIYGVILAIISVLCYSVYVFISKGAYWATDTNNIAAISFQGFGAMIVTLILAILFIFFICTLAVILEYLSKIKIAKCERNIKSEDKDVEE